MKALVLLSGGQDSATSLFWALQEYDKVEAISFDYGQRHREEVPQAGTIAKELEVEFNVIDLRGRGILSGSALTDPDQDLNAQHQKNEELPSTFTAGRNIVFLSIAGAHAYNYDCDAIVTGICQTDEAGYPDCRMEFVDAMEDALIFGLDKELIIDTPLIDKTKAETWKLAKEWAPEGIDGVDFIRKKTLTDYSGDMTLHEWGRGNLDNPASRIRKKGYEEAKAKGWI